jgi:hypothetical protein
MVKKYCSGLKNDTILGINISECCKKHDNDSGQAGDFNFIKHAKCFYRCLVRKNIESKSSFIITAVATLFVFFKMPYLIYKKIKFRNKQ